MTTKRLEPNACYHRSRYELPDVSKFRGNNMPTVGGDQFRLGKLEVKLLHCLLQTTANVMYPDSTICFKKLTVFVPKDLNCESR